MSDRMELKDQILAYLVLHPKGKRRIDDIAEALHLESGEEKANLSKTLDEMEQTYDVFQSVNGQYATREQEGVVEGRISINRSGMGYLDRENQDSIKIDEKDQNTALNGDTVLVKCHPWQVYGRVLAVIKRSRDHVIGTYVDNGHGLHFIPDEEKLQSKIIHMDVPEDFTPIDGMKVLCDIESYGIPLVLKVVQEIGYKDDPGVDITSVLLDHDIDSVFPEEVYQQVHTIPQEVLPSEKVGRKDLTGDITVTIDGDDSKDFDDAVSVVEEEDGYRLKVSIADVSHYVQEGTPLDQEAFKRGCSTYVTDRVVPMLPHELSNGICSLNPGVIRLTITCEMKVKKDGSIEDYTLYPSFIRSTERMTYYNVNQILDGNQKIQQKYDYLGNMFFVLRDCADAIRSYRTKKGAIAFGSSESEIKVDSKGHPYYVGPKERGHAEEMIEDCMIAANVCVANFMKWQEIPCVYRIHEEPSARRISDFVKNSVYLGHKLIVGKSDIHPNQIQKYLESVENTPEYPVLSMMLLRCMQKAKYDATCVGHFGLAEEEYLHFTSPIRRYPDLMVHRMLRKYSFEGCTNLEEHTKDEEKVAECAEQSSIRERMSADAEFDCDDMKKAEYMLDHIGMTAEAIITGVQAYGMYVQLPNTIEGLVRVSEMGSDYYSYDADRMQLVGTSSKRVYRVGMSVKVMCVGASKQLGTVDFALIGKNGKVYRSQGHRYVNDHHKNHSKKRYSENRHSRKDRSWSKKAKKRQSH